MAEITTKHRNVLLLGNGLNLAYGGSSWKALLNAIKKRDDFDVNTMTAPMPLRAILLTNNHLKDAMKVQSKAFWGSVESAEQRAILKHLLEMGFEDILTTNYSYELETVSVNKPSITKYALRSMVQRTTEKAELRYLLHTYNQAAGNRIWHIHGESRLPDSMILGHYWYGNMLGKLKAEMDKKKNRYAYQQKNNLPIAFDSWTDGFILGNVYILGCGFDLSEIDLWWMLNRKAREKARTGKVYFYEMRNQAKREKIELLKLLGVHIVDFDMKEPSWDDPQGTDIYRAFYRKAIDHMENTMKTQQ